MLRLTPGTARVLLPLLQRGLDILQPLAGLILELLAFHLPGQPFKLLTGFFKGGLDVLFVAAPEGFRRFLQIL